MAYGENPDETPHNAAFHQCLHCLLRKILRERDNVIILFW